MTGTALPGLRAAVVAVGLLLLAACTGGGSRGVTATPSPVALARDTCLDMVHLGRHLGVTAPAGFTVNQNPEGREELAEFNGVNLLADMYQWTAGNELPTAAVFVFANGPGDRYVGLDALGQSVLQFSSGVGGGSLPEGITPTPTTIDGGPGGVGGGTDPRALGSAYPDSIRTPLHWWTLQVGDKASGVQFIVAMAAKTKALDARYLPVILGGLHRGGCPAPRTR